MIPILYDENEMSFLSNGICRLSDIISCKVTEERNGVYECEFTYPVSGLYFSEIIEGRIIACYHDDTKTIQPFDIYSRSQPLNGAVTFYAHHISYRLNKSVLKPFTASSCAQVFNILETGDIFMNRGGVFSFWTDKQVNGDFKLKVPKSVKEILGGSEGSILDVYGKGEYLFDNFNVSLYLNRGVDNNVTICYGKNLTEFRYDSDLSECYEAVAPYWEGTTYEDDVETSIVVTLPEGYIVADGIDIPLDDVIAVSPLDLSQYFDEPPTESQLRTKAKSLLNKSEAWLIKESFDVSFARLWESGDYETYASLQRVNLCDHVTVVNPNVTGIEFKMEVIKVVYDVIEERYKSMELGSPKKNFADAVTEDIMTATDDLIKSLPNKSYMQSAIDYATKLIAGGLGGHLIIKTNANGQPEELLIMDTDNPETAVNVWRFNLNGLGHSHNGYDGPFSDIALTMDGHINATMITTGILNAGIIRAGILSDMLGNNWWNLDTGEFHLSAQSLDVMVGGTNMIRFTKEMPVDGDFWWDLDASISASIVPPSSSESDGPSKAQLEGDDYYLYGQTGVKIGELLGKPVSFSFDAYAEDQSIVSTPGPIDTPIIVGMYLISNRGALYPFEFKAETTIPANTLICGETKRLKVTFNPTDSSYFTRTTGSYAFSNDKYVVFGIKDGSSSQHENTYRFSRLKAEIGDISTDWSPAPEDDENAIQEVHNQYSTLSNTISGIQTEVGRIDQDMDSLSADFTSISQQADEISAKVDSFSMIGGSNLLKDSYSMPTTGDTAWRVSPSTSHIDQETETDLETGDTLPIAPAIATLVGNYALAGKTLLQIGDYSTEDIQIEGQEEKDIYITLSFDAKAKTSSDVKNIRAYLNLTSSRTGSNLTDGYKTTTINASDLVAGKKVRVATTFGPIKPSYFTFFDGKSYSDSLYFSFIIDGNAPNGLEVSRMKAEIGRVATDWTNQASDDMAHSFAEFTMRAGEISSKVGKGEVISSINQSAEQVKIDANKLTFAGKTVNFSTTEINLSSPENADTCYFGDDDDIMIIPEVDDKPVRPIRIGGGLGYLRFGCTDARSLVEIFSGNNQIAIGNYSIGSGTNNVFRIEADQRLELICGDYSIVLTSSGINFMGPNGILDTWS